MKKIAYTALLFLGLILVASEHTELSGFAINFAGIGLMAFAFGGLGEKKDNKTKTE